MSENLSGCLFRISLHKGIWGGGGQTELISVRGGRLPLGVPANALAQTAELVSCNTNGMLNFLWVECVKYDYQVFDTTSTVLIDGKF